MPHRSKQEVEGEVNRDNTKIVSRRFSASLRTRTIIFYIIALLIPFICVLMILFFYIPTLYSKYENKLADSEMNMFLESVQDGITSIRVKCIYNINTI